MAAFKFLLAAIVLLCISKQGEAVKCYYCSSHTDCNDDFVSSSDQVTNEANDDCLYCMKSKTIDEIAGTQRVSRGCITKTNSDSPKDMGCYSCTTGEDCVKTTSIACYCDSDDCNHGNIFRAAPLMFLLALLSKFMFV